MGNGIVVAAACILVGGVALAHASGFSGTFVLDDHALVVEDARPASLNWDTVFWLGGNGSPVAGRPLVALSFLINFAFDGAGAGAGGPEPWGYHLVNVVVHGLATLVLFGLLRRTFVRLPVRAAAVTPLAFVCTLLWAVHPIHTAAITYLSSRSEVFAGFFVLTALYALTYVEGTSRSRVAQAAAVASCFLCALSKEIAVALPLLLLLYDRTFLAGSFRAAWTRRGAMHIAAFASWLVVGAIVVAGPRSASVNLGGNGLTPLNYLLTQANAIVHYLCLVVWPTPLVLDHGWSIVPVDGPADLVRAWPSFGPAFVCVASLLLASIVGLVRRPVLGFVGAWFFLVLAPSSSIVPITTEIMAEHRMYLPLLAAIVPVVLVVHHAATRIEWPKQFSSALFVVVASIAVVAVAAAEGAVTDRQNGRYRSDVELYAHNLRVTPGNPRVMLNLGRALGARGHHAMAAKLFEDAVAAARAITRPRHPFLPHALDSAAGARLAAGDAVGAIERWQEAVRLEPAWKPPMRSLVTTLVAQDRHADAIAVVEHALARSPLDLELRGRLVALLLSAGRVEDARAAARDLPGGDDSTALERGLMEAEQRMNQPSRAAERSAERPRAAPAAR